MSILWVFLPSCILLSGASGSSRILKRDTMKTFSRLGKTALFATCHPVLLGEKENLLTAVVLHGWKVTLSVAVKALCVLRSGPPVVCVCWGLRVSCAVQRFALHRLVSRLGCSCSWTPKVLQVLMAVLDISCHSVDWRQRRDKREKIECFSWWQCVCNYVKIRCLLCFLPVAEWSCLSFKNQAINIPFLWI